MQKSLRNDVFWFFACPTLGFRIPVKVIHRDLARDLAILEFEGQLPANIRHFVGLDTPIKRHEKGILIGYPNWNAGRHANQVDASVVSRFPRNGLERFEISKNIRKGNSGGRSLTPFFALPGSHKKGRRKLL